MKESTDAQWCVSIGQTEMFYIDEENVGHDDIFVKSIDCDCFYKARPSFYFGLNQELGGLHANTKGCGLKKIYDEEQKTWMIIRTRMEIDKIVDWTDTLSLRTWCQEGFKLYAPRAVEAYDKASGESVFKTLSWWVVMDLAKKRPCRPNVFDERLPLADKEKHYASPMLPQYPDESEFSIKLSPMDVSINYYDTDYNRHVNNISYVNWMLDSFPKTFLDEYRPKLIDVKWEKQSFLEDHLVVHTLKKENTEEYLTTITRGDECVFRGLSEWVKKDQ